MDKVVQKWLKAMFRKIKKLAIWYKFVWRIKNSGRGNLVAVDLQMVAKCGSKPSKIL